jgi:hypothetical protein
VTGCSFEVSQPEFIRYYRTDSGTLDLTSTEFTLTFAGRAHPYETSPTVTRTITGSVHQDGPILRLTSQNQTFYATLGPDATNPTTVNLADLRGLIGGNGTDCQLYRFTSTGDVQASVQGEASAASYLAVSVGGHRFPYGFLRSSGVLEHDSLSVELSAGGTYTARLYYRLDGSPTQVATATGRYVGTGALRALDPDGARVSFLTETGPTGVLRGEKLRFDGASEWASTSGGAAQGITLARR